MLPDLSFDEPPAFRLRDYQTEAKDAVDTGWSSFSRQLLDMSTGTGKTSIFSMIARDEWMIRNGRSLILENRDALVRQTAREVAAKTGLAVDIEMAGEHASPFAPIVVASVQTLCRDSRLTSFSDDHFSTVIADECFPGSTMIGERPISSISVGDLVESYNHSAGQIEKRAVLYVFKRPLRALISVRFSNGASFECTPEHPVFSVSRNVYVPAIQLMREDMVLCTTHEPTTEESHPSSLFRVRKNVPDLFQGAESLREERAEGLLLPGVSRGKPSAQKFRDDGEDESEICFSQDDGEKPDGAGRREGEGQNLASRDGVEASGEKRERNWTHGASAVNCVRPWVGHGGGGSDQSAARLGVSAVLQARYGECCSEDRRGGGRIEPSEPFKTGTGQKEGRAPCFAWVDSVEVHKSADRLGLERLCPDGFVYNLEVERNNNYFANGVLVHNCHHSLAKSWAKVLNYFHFGAYTLSVEDFSPPDAGTYEPKCKVLGVTATPELSGNRHLGEFFQRIAYRYQLLQAVNDGWLVQPIAEMEPLKVNLKGLRATRTPNGSDYNATEVAERMVPVIGALAEQVVRFASNRKTMAFMPSIRTAEMLAVAINQLGLRAIFVSGECLDRDEKTADFVEHGKGIVLTTAAMYIEGFDCPDVDCVFAGITKSKSYYRQKIGRATRPLKGVVDGLATAEERRAAIAASAKPDFLIIDPFCKCHDIELCDSYDLYAEKPEIKQKMKDLGLPPNEESAKEAERDFIKALNKAARAAAWKKKQTVNPLVLSMTIGKSLIENYTPQATWETEPATVAQIATLARFHVDASKMTKGLAKKIQDRLFARSSAKLATPLQLNFLSTLGYDVERNEHEIALMSEKEASALIDTLKAEKARRAG